MKGQALSLGLATVMLVVLLYKQYEQEMDLRAAQDLVLTLEEKMQSVQGEIERSRSSIQNVQAEEEAVKKSSVELDAKKDDRTAKLEKEKASFDACQAQKKEAQDKKKAAQDQLQKFKAQRDEEKKAAEGQTGSLKQQLEEKNRLCQFVDKEQEEGRKLCGLTEAPK